MGVRHCLEEGDRLFWCQLEPLAPPLSGLGPFFLTPSELALWRSVFGAPTPQWRGGGGAGPIWKKDMAFFSAVKIEKKGLADLDVRDHATFPPSEHRRASSGSRHGGTLHSLLVLRCYQEQRARTQSSPQGTAHILNHTQRLASFPAPKGGRCRENGTKLGCTGTGSRSSL